MLVYSWAFADIGLFIQFLPLNGFHPPSFLFFPQKSDQSSSALRSGGANVPFHRPAVMETFLPRCAPSSAELPLLPPRRGAQDPPRTKQSFSSSVLLPQAQHRTQLRPVAETRAWLSNAKKKICRATPQHHPHSTPILLPKTRQAPQSLLLSLSGEVSAFSSYCGISPPALH